ncbi:hypothetical protein [Vampirovibrio chlorellavorus]|uniref:hypothetical protein n=1 Tax=Vampirovibrio chlorellavorus TaxID=758823 RepID=UPI0026EEBB58|nr:hypothetical protein [Vampirovibrio chlorellavorus]
MTVFHQLESLPIAYLLVLGWVLCATVTGKILGRTLLDSTSGSVQRLLSRDVGIELTADSLPVHVFEKAILDSLNVQIVFHCIGDFARLVGGSTLQPVLLVNPRTPEPLYPERYWSGCPPDCCSRF